MPSQRYIHKANIHSSFCFKIIASLILLSTVIHQLIFLLIIKSRNDHYSTSTLIRSTYNITPASAKITEDKESAIVNISQPAPTCVLPKLELNNSDIMKFYQTFPRLRCNKDPDWLIIEDGVFIVTNEAIRKHPDIKCLGFPIIAKTDFQVKEGKPFRIIQNTRLAHDFHRVWCTSSDKSQYKNYMAGIKQNPDAVARESETNTTGLDLDVIMLGLDSTSHLAWHRHLPRLTGYFLSELNGTEMDGYNILGDGTPPAIMPILLGHIEEELHEARRGYDGATTVDDFPWIFNEFKKAGYVTTWAEDDARLGTFQYRLKGFGKQPTDHYFRHFCVAVEPRYRLFKPHCQGSRPRHSLVLDYVRQTLTAYPKKRKWIFSFMSQLSHEDNNNLSYLDEDLLKHLQLLHTNGHLDKAILILLADHGARFAKVRTTAQGKQEERLPYFALRFPGWFHQKYPEIIKNVKANSQRLTTPFDVHETLLEILNFTGTGRADISKRGVSLFKQIPVERDCESAHIEPHWCSCLEWKKEDPRSNIITKAVGAIITTLNNYTHNYRDLCAMLALNEVTSAMSLKIKDAVLKFKGSDDGGRGRVGKMTDKTKLSSVLYQVSLVTQPGEGQFEVTLTYNVKKKLFVLDPKSISRINKYGDGPWCVEKKEPFLRPFCFCKDLVQFGDVVGNQNSSGIF